MSNTEPMDDGPDIVREIARDLGYVISYAIAESVSAEFPGYTWDPIEPAEVERILKARGYVPTLPRK